MLAGRRKSLAILLQTTFPLNKKLHIVSLDTPYPILHGGHFDLYYKLQALHAIGVEVILHCFTKVEQQEIPELNNYCKEVHFYRRKTGHLGYSLQLPYIVASRTNEALIQKLQQDQYPILLEGIHCAAPLLDARLKGRKMLLRLHNVESIYYKQLALHSRSLWKKLHYHLEARLLKKLEEKLAPKVPLLAVSQKDVDCYRKAMGAKQIGLLPVFTPFEKINSPEGIGYYCFYHGNLSVPENEKAALWLLEEVFNDLKIPFVIAGRNPSALLEKKAHEQSHTCLVANPGWKEMQDMIAKAQLHLIPSFNETGIKLKLINTLFNGRHCITNEAAVAGSGVEACCHVGNNALAFKSLVAQLYHQPFAEEETRLRKQVLESQFNNKKNAEYLLTWLY